MTSWRRTLGILWVSNFFVTSGMSLVIPFLPLYIGQLGVTNMAAQERWSGWIFSAQFVTSFIFQPIWGAVADRYGRKVMLLRAGIGMGVVTALMGLVVAPWQLLILRLVNGIFSGFISMSVSLQASVTPDEHAGRALGTLQTGAVAGNLIGPLAGGVLAETLGYNNVFFLTGAGLVAASLVVAFFVHENVAPATEQRRSRQRAPWHALMPLWPVFLASIITQVGMMTIEPIVSLYAKTLYTGRHLAMIAGLVVAVTGIGNIIASPILGQIGDRVGQRRVLVIALFMSALAFLPQALAGGIVVLLIGRFMLGLFVGGMIPSLNVLVKKMAPREVQATAFGFNSSSLFLGNMIGPLIGSSVAAAYGFKSVFYVTMSVLVLNGIIVAFNKKLNTKRLPQEA